MPVKLKIPTKHGLSNKPHITPKSDIGSSTNQSYQHELKPFIDWISVVVTPPEQDQHDIYNALWTAVGDQDLLQEATAAEKIGVGGGFNVAKRIVLPSIEVAKMRPTIFVRSLSDKKLVTKLRVNLVPVDLGADGMLDLHIALNTILPDGWPYVVEHGRVTRIDVAVDLPDLTMDSVHVQPKKASYSRRLFPNGQLETVYLGKPTSDQIAIYDRSKKRAKQGQDMAQCLRIERRVKPGNMKLTNLAALKNPFAGIKLSLALPGPPNPGKEWEWSMFSDSVEKRGLPSALALLPKDRRAAYKKHIEAHLLPAWDPDEIWNHWKPILDELKIASSDW